jgi:hypothetical protein
VPLVRAALAAERADGRGDGLPDLPVLSSSERCRADTNRASARAALMLRWCIAGRIVSLLDRRILLLHNRSTTFLR